MTERYNIGKILAFTSVSDILSKSGRSIIGIIK